MSAERVAPAERTPSASDRALLVLRIGFLVLLVGFHGWARFLRAFEYAMFGEPWTFVGLVEHWGFPLAPLFAVLSALSESVGAVLVGIGLFTRGAAAVIVVNFIVAFVNEATGGQSVELAALYLLGALVIAIAGPGAYSVDRLLAGRSRDVLRFGRRLGDSGGRWRRISRAGRVSTIMAALAALISCSVLGE